MQRKAILIGYVMHMVKQGSFSLYWMRHIQNISFFPRRRAPASSARTYFLRCFSNPLPWKVLKYRHTIKLMAVLCLISSKMPQDQRKLKMYKGFFAKAKYVISLFSFLDFWFLAFLVYKPFEFLFFWIFAQVSQRPAVTHELLWLDLVTLDIDSEASELVIAGIHICIWKS